MLSTINPYPYPNPVKNLDQDDLRSYEIKGEICNGSEEIFSG